MDLERYESELKSFIKCAAEPEIMKLQRVRDDGKVVELESFDPFVTWEILSGPNPPDLFALASSAFERHGRRNVRLLVTPNVRMYMDIQAVRNEGALIEPAADLNEAIEADGPWDTGSFQGVPIYLYDPLYCDV